MIPWGGWRGPRHPPPWWPEGEPWPPQGPPWRWRRTHARFLWRFAAAFLLFWLLAFVVFGVLGWLVANRFGAAPPHGGPPIFRPFGILFVALLVVGLLTAGRFFRGMAVPMGGIMDAIGQLAGGNYGVRVREWGPPDARSLARAFNQMAERLQAHEQQRRNLLADVTHELRTPLAVIQGNLEGLLDGVYPRDDVHLTPILEEARVLSLLIEDLRTLALAETGTLQLHRESTELPPLIDETVAGFRPQAEAAGIVLTADSDEEIPTLEVDPTRIRQVLANLVNNALQHTPAGGSVHVTCRLGRGSGQPDTVSLTVTDTGSGIAPADLPHIFDRFYKSKESRGSGLGLAIARHLITLHGGDISAHSTPGQGTAIHITLPSEPA